ncbi:MAG TPA: hypothetical protein VKE40_06945 [Gemmataceae bacterium]|nr:hypothetical protein [Gemmataceae bacterium]
MRKHVPEWVKRFARPLSSNWKRLCNVFKLPALKRRTGIAVHLGCGDDRLPGFVNIDCRPTKAADYITDLNQPRCFGPNSVSVFFSHAFFEHLYRDERGPHLTRILQSLQPDGVCCYIGLPYFKAIARMYLERAPGVVGERFDLFNVYRYTHGDPEKAVGWWLEQLHKSLFDEEELAGLLSGSRFASAAIFAYCFVGERGKPVNLGFFATKSPRDSAALRSDCLRFLSQHCQNKVLLDTVELIAVGPCLGPAGPEPQHGLIRMDVDDASGRISSKR